MLFLIALHIHAAIPVLVQFHNAEISIETQYLVHHVYTFLRFTVTLLTPMHYITDRVLPYLAEAGFVSATLPQYSSRTWETVGLAGSWES